MFSLYCVYSEQNDVITLCSSLFNSKVSNEQILRNNNWQFQNWKRLIRHPLHELFLRSSHRAERFPRDHSVANSETAVPLFVKRLHATVNAITDWASKCFMTLSFIYLSVKLFKITRLRFESIVPHRHEVWLNQVLCLSHSYFDVINDGNKIRAASYTKSMLSCWTVWQKDK